MEKTVLTYLQKKKKEFLDRYGKFSVFHTGYDRIAATMSSSFKEVTPDMVRKVELLESLLFSFIEYSEDLSLLNDMEKDLQSLKPQVHH